MRMPSRRSTPVRVEEMARPVQGMAPPR